MLPMTPVVCARIRSKEHTHVKDPCQSLVDYGNTKRPSMHFADRRIKLMYFCTVNRNSKVMICTLSSAHWQQASKLSSPCALSRFEFEKIEINTPIKRSDQYLSNLYNTNNSNPTSSVYYPKQVIDLGKDFN